MYQTFISYRRAGGSEYAARIHDYLYEKKYNPFYDITGMDAGRFDEQIRLNLINCQNFILILSCGAFDRINEPDDWVMREIQLAIDNNLNIVVLQENGFVFPDHIPIEIREISKYEAIEFNARTLTKLLPTITTQLILRTDEFETFDPLDGKSLDLSGDYLTLYEDNDDGRKVVIKAPAHLRAVWNHIYGNTHFGTQSWKISARLYKRKRIAGVYYARNVLDEGFGTFYLEIKSPSILEGFWCGYDNKSHQISSGKYLFKKVYKDYTIRPMGLDDFGQVIQIADSQLGKDYVTPEILNSMVGKGSSMRCYVAVDNKKNNVIGFYIYDTIDYQHVLDITKNSPVRELMYTKQIGYLKTIAIDKSYAGYGIATSIVRHCLEEGKKNNINAFISPAWKHGGKINIENVLLKNGFKRKNEISNYWYEASQKEGFMCPQCGNPCHCSCVIFIKYKS